MSLPQTPIVTAGARPEDARVAVILIHGRGASAESILTLSSAFAGDSVAYLAPQAPGGTWYPFSFLAPIFQNEPALTQALESVDGACHVALDAGLPWHRLLVIGFSQGACLSLEFAARNPRRYGGVVAFSGGLIGNGQIPGVDPPVDKRFDYTGSLEGTPVFVGCSDVDPHIPVQRVHDSSDALRGLGADVTERVYPGMPHTINDDEIAFARALIQAAAAGRETGTGPAPSRPKPSD